MPDPLVSRLDSFSELSHHLDSQLCVAVVGYPRSGKTTSVAEYMRAHPDECMWIDAADSHGTQRPWRDLVLYRMARYLNLADATVPTIQQALIERSHSQRLVIVIDDAHVLSNLDSISPLLQAAAASHNRIKLVLVGIDEPSFLEWLRSAPYPDWRLPGMTEAQAREMFESDGRRLSELQRHALDLLVQRTDGHAGMLRLALQRVYQIETETDLGRMLKEFVGELGGGLEAFQANLIKRFQDALNRGEKELCLRLAIAFGAFSKRLAKALWLIDRSENEFASVWNDCVLRVFEFQSDGRHSLPELYRRGLLAMLSPTDAVTWHSAAANELSSPQNNRLDPVDVTDSVLHRVLAGQSSQAIEDAAKFLACATGKAARPIRQFLIRRFELWLTDSLSASDVSPTSVVRWLAVVLRVYREDDHVDRCNKAALQLQDTLQSSEANIEESAIQLGWSVLLTHAATLADTTLAEQAADKLEHHRLAESLDSQFDWVTVTVISTYATAGKNPINYLLKIFASRSRTAPRLWDARMGFDLWRAVTAIIASETGREQSAEKNCRLLLKIADFSEQCGEIEISVVIKTAVSRMQIDDLRNFDSAVATARSITASESIADARLRGLRQHSLGNALRCAGDLANAELAYREAIAAWPASSRMEKAESMVMLGICEGRRQCYSAAVRTLLDAERLYAKERKFSTELHRSQCLLEASTSAVHSNQYGKSLRCLIRAHQLLRYGDLKKAEWVTLGQLAWHFLDRMTGNTTGPETVVPGFTLGLRGPVPGAEQMEPHAPTLLLGAACVSYDLPNRGLQYILTVWHSAASPERRIAAALFGFDAAVLLHRLDLSAEFAIAEIEFTWGKPDAAKPHGHDNYILNHRLERVIDIILDISRDAAWLEQLKSARTVVQEYGNTFSPAKSLLIAVFNGMISTEENGSDDALDSAYRLALESEARVVARQICCFWIFRHAIGRPIAESDLLIWAWRLIWLTSDAVSSDVDLRHFLDQQRELWERASSVDGFEWASLFVEAVIEPHVDSTERFHRFRDRVVERVNVVCGVARFIDEVACQIANTRTLRDAGHLCAPATTALGNLLLLPVSSEFSSCLGGQIASLRTALGNRDSTAEGYREWDLAISTLETLLAVIESGDFVTGTRDALFYLEAVASAFSAASEANYYVWLRQSVQGGDATPEQIQHISKVITTPRVLYLLTAADVPEFLRTRLSITYYGTIGVTVAKQIAHALLLMQARDAMFGSERLSVQSPSEAASIDTLMDEFDGCIEKLKKAESDSRAAGASGYDLWWVCFDRSNLQKLLAGFLHTGSGSREVIENLLKASVQGFRDAILAAREITAHPNASLLMRAAIEGETAALALGDAVAAAEFNSELEHLGSHPANQKELAQLRREQQQDLAHPLNQRPRKGSHSLRTGGEEQIQQMTDFVMKAAGYPRDRRRHVENDVRKLARAETAQWEYCRHLQPLQNLTHVQSNDTAYSCATCYTCSCSLLGHQTRIEQEDIDMVIDAMQRTFCENCDKRSPLKDGESATAHSATE